jgi:hypothetical protein
VKFWLITFSTTVPLRKATNLAYLQKEHQAIRSPLIRAKGTLKKIALSGLCG